VAFLASRPHAWLSGRLLIIGLSESHPARMCPRLNGSEHDIFGIASTQANDLSHSSVG
jgi:hypothetical protein